MDIKKLTKTRKKIDIIDSKIFNLIKKRTLAINQIIKIKKKKNQIFDKKRNNQILKKIKKKSKKNKIDPRITVSLWKTMISSYVDYQKRNFKKK